MHDLRPDAPLPRRALVARLAGAVLSIAGLSAFTRAAPNAPDATPMPNAPKWDDRFELAVDLEIAAQEGFRYHRPYVAVWVEDAAGKPVRTLSLWVNTTGRGPRYIRELKRWFYAEGQPEAGGPDLVS
ncbi:MAG: DUF2271 domain-containing protein, partial [Gemmatirosa sp.]|nr:DUF2271 domain-containing protein [Gemmatirosa sp.]